MATEAQTHSSSAPESRQRCHVPCLSACNQKQLAQALEEASYPITSGWSASYCSWWQDQSRTESKLLLFPVQLIGDAEKSDQFTCMGYTDLAFCSEWGQTLVEGRDPQQSILQAIVPVVTTPEIVQTCVTGLLCGEITLSVSNVEAVLVLANAIGLESLEQTCIKYLSDAAHMMTDETLRCVMGLAQHLGLPDLLESLASALVIQPWTQHMNTLAHITSYFYQTKRDLKALLHHPNRGAYLELQMLQLLEVAGLPEKAISDVLDVTLMESAEMNMFFKILLNKEHSSQNLLLRKALQQHVQDTALQSQLHSNTHTRIVDKVMLPDCKQPPEFIQLPDSELLLQIAWDPDGGTAGVYLGPQQGKPGSSATPVQTMTIFALHSELPYVRADWHLDNNQLQELQDAVGPQDGDRPFLGFSEYLSDLVKEVYTSDYRGPFCIGITWTTPRLVQTIEDRCPEVQP